MLIVFLGALRTATDAELTFASFALLPVLLIAWVGGTRDGLIMALLASTMWAAGDFATERQFSSPWIPWANLLTRMVTYGIVASLAAQVHLLFERENERATQDFLTGLLNRRSFREVLLAEIERSRRYAHPLTIIFLDLDNFKQLNDTKGHATGDSALQDVATTLRDSLRTGDSVARLGGDEFAVLLPEIGYEDALGAGTKISAAITYSLKKFPPVGVSIGIAWFGRVTQTGDDLIEAADALMYEVKSNGKGGVQARRFSS